LWGRLRREIIQKFISKLFKIFLFNFLSNFVQFPRVSVLLFILFILTELFLFSFRMKRIGKIFSFYSFYSFEILLGRLRREIIKNLFQNYSKSYFSFLMFSA